MEKKNVEANVKACNLASKFWTQSVGMSEEIEAVCEEIKGDADAKVEQCLLRAERHLALVADDLMGVMRKVGKLSEDAKFQAK